MKVNETSLKRIDPDTVLVREIKKGNEQAFKKLVEKYKDSAFSFALHLIGHYEDAQDISQDAFAKVYFKIQDFREESSFKTWFYKIIVNLCRTYHKKKKFRSFITLPKGNKDSEKDILLFAEDDVENNILRKEKKIRIEKAIEKLPLKQKEAFIMKHMEGMKIKDIAKASKCTESTVKTHIFRAVSFLKEKLQDKE